MVLHAWTESGDRLCVRMTSTPSVATQARTTSYATEPAEVLHLVALWLDQVADGEPPADRP